MGRVAYGLGALLVAVCAGPRGGTKGSARDERSTSFFGRRPHAPVAVGCNGRACVLGPGPVCCSDIAGRRGVGLLSAEVVYLVGDSPRWVAVADFNRDGYLDVAAANYRSGNMSVLLGNGDGTLRTKVDYPAGAGPTLLAVGYSLFLEWNAAEAEERARPTPPSSSDAA